MATWLLFALLYPLLYAFVNILDKFLLAKRIKNYYSYAVITGLAWIIIGAISLMVVGIPDLPLKILLLTIFTGLAYGFITQIYYHLVTDHEISRVIGMIYLSAAVTAILSYFLLSETLSPLKYGAIILAIIGTIVLGQEQITQLKFSHVFKLLLVYVSVLGLLGVTEKYLLSYLTAWELFALLYLLAGPPMLLSLFKQKVRQDFVNTAKSIPVILLIQMIGIFAYAAYLLALSLQKVSLVFSLGTLQPVYVFMIMLLISIFIPHILKEVITPRTIIQKVVGIGLVIAGVIILNL